MRKSFQLAISLLFATATFTMTAATAAAQSDSDTTQPCRVAEGEEWEVCMRVSLDLDDQLRGVNADLTRIGELEERVDDLEEVEDELEAQRATIIGMQVELQSMTSGFASLEGRVDRHEQSLESLREITQRLFEGQRRARAERDALREQDELLGGRIDTLEEDLDANTAHDITQDQAIAANRERNRALVSVGAQALTGRTGGDVVPMACADVAVTFVADSDARATWGGCIGNEGGEIDYSTEVGVDFASNSAVSFGVLGRAFFQGGDASLSGLNAVHATVGPQLNIEITDHFGVRLDAGVGHGTSFENDASDMTWTGAAGVFYTF